MNEKTINKEFSNFGLALKRDAMISVCKFINKFEDPEEVLKEILDNILSNNQDSLITQKTIEDVIASMKKSASPTHHIFAFQSAFDMPKFKFDRSERTFIPADKPTSILGTAQDKIAVYKERHQILKTCLIHTKEFHASSVQFGLDTQHSLAVTDIASLISKPDETIILLGYLDSDGSTVRIEDPSGIIEIDTGNLKQMVGLFSVGCIVLLQADYRDERVYGSLIGHPPIQKTDAFFQLFWKAHTDPFGWGITKDASIELESLLHNVHQESLFLFFSDVWIDIPSVLDDFDYALSQFRDDEPNAIVISGSFTSRPFSFDQFANFEKLFMKFCKVIKKHDRIYKNSQIVILPSLNDIGSSHVYPRESFSPSIQKHLISEDCKNIHFLTNPCRMRFLNQTITIFRDDLLKRMLNASVLPVADKDLHQHLISTILNQRHLLPVDLEHAPIAWPYDYTLRLYPPPDVLALCDSGPAWATTTAGCLSFNPGQFGSNKTYVQYFPGEKRAVVSSLT